MIELRLSETTISEINHLIDLVEQELLNPANVRYFEISSDQPHEHQMSVSNVERLSSVAARPGVYAIWVQQETAVAPQYIGQTAGKTARTRLINHFFKKHPRTGSQLNNVKAAVASGHKVGFTYVALNPPLIRLYVEVALITRHHQLCVWNIQGKLRQKLPSE